LPVLGPGSVVVLVAHLLGFRLKLQEALAKFRYRLDWPADIEPLVPEGSYRRIRVKLHGHHRTPNLF
jgi:hypothetical protein